MPKMPIDVNAVLSAATDIDAARRITLHVVLFLDPTASEELQTCVRRAFETTSPQATVEVRPYTREGATVKIGCDIGVLVAGASPETVQMVNVLHADGVPAVVVTANPQAVLAAAQANGLELAKEDVIAPDPTVDGGRFAPDDAFNCEPYPMTVDRERSMIDRLGQWFAATFNQKRLAFALAFSFVRKPFAFEMVKISSMENAAIGAVPLIPGADMPLMTLNQAKMVFQIAAAYGLDVGTARWRELLAVVGSGFLGRTIARELVGLVPVLGWAARGSVGYGMTFAMGFGAIKWFEKQTSGIYEVPEDDPLAEKITAQLQKMVKTAAPYAKGVGAAATTLATDAAHVFSEAAAGAFPYVRNAAAKVQESASPVVERVSDSVGAAAFEGIGNSIPVVKETVEEFCRRQNIDPSQFLRQIFEAYQARNRR